jgi:hypothetical protein
LDALADFGEFVFARKTHLPVQELAKFWQIIHQFAAQCQHFL